MMPTGLDETVPPQGAATVKVVITEMGKDCVLQESGAVVTDKVPVVADPPKVTVTVSVPLPAMEMPPPL